MWVETVLINHDLVTTLYIAVSGDYTVQWVQKDMDIS